MKKKVFNLIILIYSFTNVIAQSHLITPGSNSYLGVNIDATTPKIGRLQVNGIDTLATTITTPQGTGYLVNPSVYIDGRTGPNFNSTKSGAALFAFNNIGKVIQYGIYAISEGDNSFAIRGISRSNTTKNGAISIGGSFSSDLNQTSTGSTSSYGVSSTAILKTKATGASNIWGVFGQARVDSSINGSGAAYGVQGLAYSINNRTVYGVMGGADFNNNVIQSTGTRYGVYGSASSKIADAYGVYGTVKADSAGYKAGVYANAFIPSTATYNPLQIRAFRSNVSNDNENHTGLLMGIENLVFTKSVSSISTSYGISNLVNTSSDNSARLVGISNIVGTPLSQLPSGRVGTGNNVRAFTNIDLYGDYNFVTSDTSQALSKKYGSYVDVNGINGNKYGYYADVKGTNGTAYGIYATVANAATATKFAGYFVGDVQIAGNLSKSSGSFKIDHPQDPENKYLVHSFVESPDMMNVYNGNIITNNNGEAVVELPAYFEALNKEFRYQLTPIGELAQVAVIQKIKNNQFKVKSSVPNLEVSWQVTGIRKDPYAEAHRLVPEVPKTENERGHYLHPELYKKSASMRVNADSPTQLIPSNNDYKQEQIQQQNQIIEYPQTTNQNEK